MPNTKVKNQQKTSQKQFDFILCITVFLLLALGIVMVLSASAPSSLSEWRKQLSLCNKPSIFCIIWCMLNVCNI